MTKLATIDAMMDENVARITMHHRLGDRTAMVTLISHESLRRLHKLEMTEDAEVFEVDDDTICEE